MKLFNPDFFLFMAAISLVASIAASLGNDELQSSISAVCMLVCAGFYAVLGRLDDTDKK